MSYYTRSDLQKQESEVQKNTNDESPEIGWFYEYDKALQQIISTIPKERSKEELPENPAIYILLVATSLKIMRTSHSILNLISRGYYHQGMVLLRMIQEEFHHLLFFTFSPNNSIKQWMEGKIKYKQINKFTKKSKIIPKRWMVKNTAQTTMYKVLSSYVHPSLEGWSSIIVGVQKQPLEIVLKITPRYENNSFNTVFSGLMIFLGNTITLLMEKYEIEIKEAGFWDDITLKMNQFSLEYLLPLIELMKLDEGKKIIG